jgi:hypothetical protein
MSITLRSFQDRAVRKIISGINEIEQDELANSGQNLDNTDSCRIVLKSPTGSGKTVMISKVIEDKLKDNYATILFSPGQGQLENQTRDKLNSYFTTSGLKAEILTPESVSTPLSQGDVYVTNWEKLSRTDRETGELTNVITRDDEWGSLESAITATVESGTPLAIIIDESHYGTRNRDSNIVHLLTKIQSWVATASSRRPVIIEMSATPITRIGHNPSKFIAITNSEVKEAQLMRKGIIRNDADKGGLDIRVDEDPNDDQVMDTERTLMRSALKRLDEIDAGYAQAGENQHGLIGVNIPNGRDGNAAMERIESWMADHGISKANGQLAEVLSDEKTVDIKSISSPDSPVRVLIYKQAISTGWDCPRAQILIGFRHIKSRVFSVQNMGRFLRTTNGKYYSDPDLDFMNWTYVYDNSSMRDVERDPDSIIEEDKTIIPDFVDINLNSRWFADRLNNYHLPKTVLKRTGTRGFTKADLGSVIQPVYQAYKESTLLNDQLADMNDQLLSGRLKTEDLDELSQKDSISFTMLSTTAVKTAEANVSERLFKEIEGVVNVTVPAFPDKANLIWNIIDLLEIYIKDDSNLKSAVTKSDAVKLMIDPSNLQTIKNMIRTSLEGSLFSQNDDGTAPEAVKNKNNKKEFLASNKSWSLGVSARVPTAALTVPDDRASKYLYMSSGLNGAKRQAFYTESGRRSSPENEFEKSMLELKDSTDGRLELSTFFKIPPYANREDSLSMVIFVTNHDGSMSSMTFYPDYLLFIHDLENNTVFPLVAEIKDKDGGRETPETINAKAKALEQYSEHTGLPCGLFHDVKGRFMLHGEDIEFNDYCMSHRSDKITPFKKNAGIPDWMNSLGLEDAADQTED